MGLWVGFHTSLVLLIHFQFPSAHRLPLLPRQIFGPESSGKTTLALHAIAEAQKAGKACVFIDAEHALDKQYAQVGLGQDGRLG